MEKNLHLFNNVALSNPQFKLLAIFLIYNLNQANIWADEISFVQGSG